MNISTATGVIVWLMCRVGLYGWTSFWPTIYVLPDHENNAPAISSN